jgi:hypothetical protein
LTFSIQIVLLEFVVDRIVVIEEWLSNSSLNTIIKVVLLFVVLGIYHRSSYNASVKFGTVRQ